MKEERITVWAIVGSIILGFFVSLVATVIFAWSGKEIPTPIGHLLDVAFGALATLLAQTREESHQRTREGNHHPIPIDTAPVHPLEVKETQD